METFAEVKQVVNEAMTAWEEYKRANDAALAEIRKNGVESPETKAKLAKLEAAMSKGEELNQKLTVAEQEAKAAKEEASEAKRRLDEVEARLNRPRSGGDVEEAKAQRKAAHNAWLRGVVNAITLGEVNLPEDQRKALADVRAEAKALGLTPDTAGGYLAPSEYVREMIKAVTEISPVRQLVRVRQTVNRSIQLPKRTGQFAAAWVAEQGTRSETTGLTYGLEEIHTHELYALIDISNQMLEDSAFDMEAELRMEAAEQFAVAEGAAVVDGNGVGRPEGWLHNSDVASTNSGSAATIADANGRADGLIALYHAVKTAYARNGTWALNRTTLGSVRKLKDGDNNYIWTPGLAELRPNTILGAPYVEVPDMPNEAASAFPIAFGDFRRAYVLVDRIAMEMLRDPYTQATSGNVRFIFRRRVGGQVVLPEAIRLLKCAS